ncbi:MAG: hypothetical protein ACLQGP_37325 [Isosphaeraceae bacterium]
MIRWSGLAPPKWYPLYSAAVADEADRARLSQAMRVWASPHAMQPDDIDWTVDP